MTSCECPQTCSRAQTHLVLHGLEGDADHRVCCSLVCLWKAQMKRDLVQLRRRSSTGRVIVRYKATPRTRGELESHVIILILKGRKQNGRRDPIK